MAASMDFFPGGAEDDDFDDDGFILDDDDISEEKIDWSQFKSNEQNKTLNKVNGTTTGSGGFGRPPPKKGPTRQSQPRMGEINPRTRDQSSLGMDDFRMAAIKGSLDALKSFLDNGFGVNTTLKCGWTALLYAANSANVDVVEMLIGYGADVNGNKDMYTVLMAACGSSSNNSVDVEQVVNILLENGADIHAHDRYHMSPLIYAAREGRDTVVTLLLDKGANINKQDARGWTALSWAVSKNKKKTVKLLLEKNANPKMKHCDNQTAMDLAVDMENEQMIALLGGETDNNTEKVLADTPKPVVTKADGDNAYRTSSSETGIRYGEMELFLAGLDLSNYVELFQTQQVDFSTFLRMTDEDLIKMGINQIGVRKKILEGIQGVHKKEWEKSSINSPANKQISCADSVAMVANICKHVKYIACTIGYIRDQVTTYPQILRVQDGTSPKQIYQHSQDALLNVQELQTELHKLNTHLHKALQTTDFDPPDLIKPKRVKKRKLNKKGLFVLGLCAGTVAVVLWKRQDIQNSISKLIIV